MGSAVVVTGALAGLRAMERESPATPLIFVNLPDPVKTGLVSSLSRRAGMLLVLLLTNTQLRGSGSTS